jgi:hypothetical protein
MFTYGQQCFNFTRKAIAVRNISVLWFVLRRDCIVQTVGWHKASSQLELARQYWKERPVECTVCGICTVAYVNISKERDILRYVQSSTHVQGYYPFNVDRFSAWDPWRAVVNTIMCCTFGFRKIAVCLPPVIWNIEWSVDVKFFAAHAFEAYRGSRGVSPLILHVGTRWRWVVDAPPRPLYPPPIEPPHILKRLGGLQGSSGRIGEEK